MNGAALHTMQCAVRTNLTHHRNSTTLSLMATVPFQLTSTSVDGAPAAATNRCSRTWPSAAIPEAFWKAAMERHPKHRQGFLLSRLAAMEILSSGDMRYHHRGVDVGGAWRVDPGHLIDRDLAKSGGVGLLSYSHEDTHNNVDGGADISFAAALLSNPPIDLSGAAHEAPRRIAVDVVSVDRIQSVCESCPRWAARWLGASAHSNAAAASPELQTDCHWTDVFPLPRCPPGVSPQQRNKFVDLAIGWGVRECAVKLLGTPSRAYRMKSITEVVTVSSEPNCFSADEDGGFQLPWSVAFDGGIDADAWRQQQLEPMFRFGAVFLRVPPSPTPFVAIVAAV